MTKTTAMPITGYALVVFAAMLLSGRLLAHSDDHKEEAAPKVDYHNAEMHAFGKAADPAKAARTIVIEMSDSMRFSPDVVEVAKGEIVRFEIHNGGKLLHEMVLGTTEELEEHAAMMKKFPGMEHEEPYMAHVGPSKKMQMGWQFTEAGEFHFACLVPGHYEAGMTGVIKVR